jgi:uncharacterized iron-regulated protein
MAYRFLPFPALLFFVFVAGTCLGEAAPLAIDANADALARAMERHRVVLLGEVHDNAIQHRLRAAALERLVARGARPAIAFEQFDRERQHDIDRARRERPRDADYLIERAQGDAAWDWRYYRPFVALALEHDLPIVAANLSHSEAMQVARQGWRAIFDMQTRKALALDALPTELEYKQEEAIAAGHCGLLPASALPAQARAQIARDIVMSQAIVPHADRGVVLLAGNGHVRRDIGVPFWLPANVARRARSIGLLERDGQNGKATDSTHPFDAYVITDPVARPDPCADLAKRLPRAPR